MTDYGQNAVQVGDILMFHGDQDCGDISVNGGIVQMTDMFETYTYLTLLGGNQGDDRSSSADKAQWWGNEGEPNERQYRSRTQAMVNGRAVNSANIMDIRDAVQADLEDAYITQNFADSVAANARIVGPKKVEIYTFIILKDGQELHSQFEVSGL